jgi:MFS family permease
VKDVEEIEGRRKANRTAFAVSPGVLLAGVAGGIAFPILPAVGLRQGMPLVLIGAILSANRLGRIVTGPIVGVAADRIGGRKLLLAGLVTQIAVIGLFLLGVTTHRAALFFLLGRLIHGPGSASVFVSAQALALHAGGKSHGGFAAGTVRAAMSIGLPLGLVLGGVLSSHIGDAGAFGASIAALIFATGAAWVFVPDDPIPPGRRPGIREVVRALANPELGVVGALNFAVSFSALGLVLTTLVLVVGARQISVGGLDPKQTASYLMGAMVLVMGAATVAASRLTHRRRAHAWTATAGLVLLVPGLLLIGYSDSIPALTAGMVVLGAGAGALSASLLALIGDLVRVERRGSAVGLLQLCGDLGGFAGPIVGSALLTISPATAYVGPAVLAGCMVPLGIWLALQPDHAPS